MFQFSSWYLRTIQISRVSSCNLHSDIFSQCSVAAFQFYHCNDFAASMAVSSNDTVCFVASETTQGNVFTDFSDFFCYQCRYCLTVQFGSSQSFNVCRFGSSNMSCDSLYHFFEFVCFSNEVCFAVHFQDNACFAIFGNVGTYDTFSSNTAGFFCSACQTFFT